MTRRVIASGRSCLECRRRKIKCDRSLPCAYCTRTKLQCTYPSRRPQILHDEESALATRVQSIGCALKSLEQKVTHIGSLLQVSPETSNIQGHCEQGHQSPLVRIQQSKQNFLSSYTCLQLFLERRKGLPKSKLIFFTEQLTTKSRSIQHLCSLNKVPSLAVIAIQ